ncbi:MAG: DNA primase [Sphingopyxis sp.]
MTLTPAWLDELRARTVLSALIGKSVKITRAGREYKACCPFHDEKTPSFTINDDKGFYHCLAAETVVVTAAGRVPISSLSGKDVTVLSRGGQWIKARFADYGEQQLWRIALSRNGVRKDIFATAQHRWFVHDRTREYPTCELKQGHALQSALPERRSDWTLDPEGVRHGVVFGDGTMYKGVYGTLNLHGEKDAQLRRWFPAQEHHVHEREDGALYLRIYGGRAFSEMKQLPKSGSSDAYLLGFLAGYLAADGHVAKDGTVMLNSASAETLEAIRDISASLGIVTYGRTTLMRKGSGKAASALHRIHFVSGTLSEELFLLSMARQRFQDSSKKYARLRWVVRSVEPSERFETVYCAEVPSEHAFVLDDNILTGNCFGCGAHGDAIRWMTEQRGLAFMDAVKELAVSAGMEVPAPDPRAAKRAEQAVSLRDVTETSARWFAERLASDEGALVRDYLKARALSPATIAAFALGYAPDARTRLRDALGQFGDALSVEAGMLIAPPDDTPANRRTPYDRFRGRLIIPIRDARGRVIAFGGRILGVGEPKYLNSPDTPLFDKGRVLFNLDRAAGPARKVERLIVVEGYMDVIALAEVGIDEAVAPLGTALSEHQIELAWRQANVPILAFDGDAAGVRAAMRAALRALPMLRPGYSLSFLQLPAGQDPDDVVRNGGRAAFDALAASPTALVDLLWTSAMAARRDETPEARAAVRAQLMDWTATITDREVAAHYRQAYRTRLDAAFFAQGPRASQGPRDGKAARRFVASERAPTPALRQVGAVIDASLCDAILAGLLRYPMRIVPQIELLSHLAIAEREGTALLHAMIDAALTHEGLDNHTLLAILEGTSLYNKAQQLLRADGMSFSFTRSLDKAADQDGAKAQALRELDEVIATAVAWPQVNAALAAATDAMRNAMDAESFAEQQRLLRVKAELAGRLAGLAETPETI